MERTKSFGVSILLAFFAFLLSFSFVACSSTVVSGAASKTDSVKLSFSGCVETTKDVKGVIAIIKNTYKAKYTGSDTLDANFTYKVSLEPFGNGEMWKEFKKSSITSYYIASNISPGYTTLTVNGVSTNSTSTANASAVGWEVEVPRAGGKYEIIIVNDHKNADGTSAKQKIRMHWVFEELTVPTKK